MDPLGGGHGRLMVAVVEEFIRDLAASEYAVAAEHWLLSSQCLPHLAALDVVLQFVHRVLCDAGLLSDSVAMATRAPRTLHREGIERCLLACLVNRLADNVAPGWIADGTVNAIPRS